MQYSFVVNYIECYFRFGLPNPYLSPGLAQVIAHQTNSLIEKYEQENVNKDIPIKISTTKTTCKISTKYQNMKISTTKTT